MKKIFVWTWIGLIFIYLLALTATKPMPPQNSGGMTQAGSGGQQGSSQGE